VSTPEDTAAASAAAPQAALRSLAPVDEVLHVPLVAELCERYPRPLVVEAVRTVLDRLRREIRAGERTVAPEDVTAESVAPWVVALVETAVRPSLRRVINALGVVGHTNLGRSLLPDEAVRALVGAATSYTDFEIDLASGSRGSRQAHVHDILCTLTGAEDALVVNNNAAAVLLALAATARGGEVLVSRGQLVEIGDGFRIPDILRESGAQLVEVGTTNRTYLSDFEQAWTERTRAVLRVHTSNYRIVGFTAEPPMTDLVALASSRGAVMIDDLGSGALGALEVFAEEPGVSESVAAGADVVTFSGDKLLGGPQAGIAVGRAAAIEAMRKHPLARAVRIDKLGIAALDALLRLYLDPQAAVRRVPTLAMLAATQDEVAARAARLGELLTTTLLEAGAGEGAPVPLGADALEVVTSVARAGAGALPVTDVPSAALAVRPPDGDAQGLADRLRTGRPSVLARVREGRLLLDLRAVRDEEVEQLAAAVARALR
jgi:L-seryl-tRNA(Ser) seleniumtransferase